MAMEGKAYRSCRVSMKRHINKVTAACYHQLRRLRQIRRRVGTEATTQLVLAVVTSRLDYCNSVLAALPQSTTEPLQRVQNTAARLIFNFGRCQHVSAALATNSSQNYLRALHPRAQRSHRKVSALSGRNCAAYVFQSDTLRFALSL